MVRLFVRHNVNDYAPQPTSTGTSGGGVLTLPRS